MPRWAHAIRVRSLLVSDGSLTSIRILAHLRAAKHLTALSKSISNALKPVETSITNPYAAKNKNHTGRVRWFTINSRSKQPTKHSWSSTRSLALAAAPITPIERNEYFGVTCHLTSPPKVVIRCSENLRHSAARLPARHRGGALLTKQQDTCA